MSLEQSPVTEELKHSLAQLSNDKRASNLLIRHFAIQDDLANAFRVLHVMKELGIPRDRETYRYLMFGCCKYYDAELAMFVLENMLIDRKPDFKSFKRFFDVCAANSDLRFWVVYDVMMWFYPLKGAPSAALKTTGLMSEFLKTLGMKASERAGRGYVTLPHHRGEPLDVWEGMFEDEDPNYPDQQVEAVEGSEPCLHDRLMLAVEEFQDRHRLKQIVAANRRSEEQKNADEHEKSLTMVDPSCWTLEKVSKTITVERGLEVERIDKLKESKRKLLEERAKPLPRLWPLIVDNFQKRTRRRRD